MAHTSAKGTKAFQLRQSVTPWHAVPLGPWGTKTVLELSKYKTGSAI